MQVTTFSNITKDSKKYLEQVVITKEALVVEVGNEDSLIILTLDEYNSLCASSYENSNEITTKRLKSSIEKIN